MKNSKLKLCSFYVSDWHLTAMLLPFIEEKVKEEENMSTILTKDITYNMKEILTRIKIDKEVKEKIIKIGWKSKNLIKYGETKRYLDKVIRNKKEAIILIEGNKETIEYINKNIDRWLDKQMKKQKKIELTIIDCYEITEFNTNLQEILDQHDKILNTSGIHEIQEMYAGYTKKRA